MKTRLAGLLVWGLFFALPGWGQTFAQLDPQFDFGSGLGTALPAPDNLSVCTAALPLPGNQMLVYSRSTAHGGGALLKVSGGGVIDRTANLPTFRQADGSPATVTQLLSQPDGKVLAIGTFAQVNGQARPLLVRLNANLTVDASFIPPTFQRGEIYQILLQPDGKVVLVGSFQYTAGSTTVYGLARLMPTGAVDAGFAIGEGVGPSGEVIHRAALQPDGKLVLAGNMTRFNGQTVTNFIRLNVNGTRETSFRLLGPSSLSDPKWVHVLPSGEFALAGRINYGINSQVGIFRFSNTGTYISTLFSGIVQHVLPLASGEYMVAGDFPTIGTRATNNLVRLTSNFTIDPSFQSSRFVSTSQVNIPLLVPHPESGYLLAYGSDHLEHILPNGHPNGSFRYPFRIRGNITALALQPDGKILVAGRLTGAQSKPVGFSLAGKIRASVIRLHPNGALDTQFRYQMPTLRPMENIVQIQVAQDGNIWLTGYQDTTIGTNSVAYSLLQRLQPDGSVNPAFTHVPISFERAMGFMLQPDGKALFYTSRRLWRVEPTGQADPTFQTFTNFLDKAFLTSQGNTLVAGSFFHSVRPFFRYEGVALLDSRGNVDTTFRLTRLPSQTSTVFEEPDKSLIIAGDLFGRGTNGFRVDSSGRFDSTFLPVIDPRYARARFANGFYFSSGGPTSDMAVLRPDFSLDTNLLPIRPSYMYPNLRGSLYLAQPDGKLLITDNPNASAVEQTTGVRRVMGLAQATGLPAYYHNTSGRKSYSLYPNPGQGSLRITGLSQMAQVQLYSLQGREVRSQTLQPEQTLDLSSLAPGMYVVRVSEGTQTQTLRWVKK